MLGNIHFLDGDYAKAKKAYRQTLALDLQPHMEADVLNNLAFSSWMHVLDLPKHGDDNPMKDQILKEESFTMTYMLQSIELREKTDNTLEGHELLEQLTDPTRYQEEP